MMIELNLLPPEEKELIAGQRNMQRALRLGGFGLFFVLIFLALLASIWLYLSVQLKVIEQVFEKIQNSQTVVELNKFKSEMTQANKKLADYENLGKGIKNYSAALEKLISLAPPGIKFNNLSLKEDNISLEGHADKREILLSFKDALEKSSAFDHINSPLSNFLKQSDIDFSFTLQIKPAAK